MKVLYVLSSLAHFPYHESSISYLCAAGDHVLALFDQRKSRRASAAAANKLRAENPGFVWDWLIRRKDRWRRPLFAARELRSYANYLRHKEQSDYYLTRWEGYLPAPLKILVKFDRLKKFLASNEMWDRLALLEKRVPPNAAITKSLIRYGPDVVVASPMNMGFSEEVEYVKAAKALGIPTVVPVLSWDNLTTKGLFHIVPDLTLVWNRTQLDEASSIHGVPRDRITITGAPFFDKWFDLANQTSHDNGFYRNIGVEPGSPFLLYLGSSANIAEDETWLVREILIALRRHQDAPIKDIKIVVRPHPANSRVYEALSDPQVIVYPKAGQLPDSQDRIRDFFYALRSSVATVGINTSAMIDAIIADKPTLTIITDRYRSTQRRAVHFRYLLDSDVLEIANSPSECIQLMQAISNGRDSKKEQRRQFVSEFIRPNGLDIPAGKIVASAIRRAAQSSGAERIDIATRVPSYSQRTSN